MVLRGRLKKLDPTTAYPQPRNYIGRYCSDMMRAILDVFQDEMRRRKFAAVLEPLEEFLRRHIRHPGIEYLLMAIERGDDYHVEQLMRRISSGGWRHLLATVNKRGTRASFAYAAKAGGRRAWGLVPEDTSPLLDERRQEVAPQRGNVDLITATFREKFAAPAAINLIECEADPSLWPPPPFRERI